MWALGSMLNYGKQLAVYTTLKPATPIYSQSLKRISGIGSQNDYHSVDCFMP